MMCLSLGPEGGSSIHWDQRASNGLPGWQRYSGWRTKMCRGCKGECWQCACVSMWVKAEECGVIRGGCSYFCVRMKLFVIRCRPEFDNKMIDVDDSNIFDDRLKRKQISEAHFIFSCPECTPHAQNIARTCICRACVELIIMVAPLLPADSTPFGPSAVVQLYGTDNLVPLALPIITQWHHVFDSFACGHWTAARAGVGPHQPWLMTSTASVLFAWATT